MSSFTNHARNVVSNGRVEPALKEPLNSAPLGATPQSGAREWPAASSPRSSIYSHRTRMSGPELGRPSDAGDRFERRSERERVSVVDRVTIRTRSPVKDPDYLTYALERKRSSPLASRVAPSPSANHAPSYLRPRALNQLSRENQEAAILADLPFVFMGLEGQYLRYADSYDRLQEQDRLAGPDFHIFPGLDPSLRDLTTTMLKMATHYAAVNAFVEIHSQDDFGAVNHALCAGMRRYVDEYLELVAELENQLLTDPGFTLHLLHLRILPTSHDFFQLFTLSQEILRTNSMLEANIEDCIDNFEDVEQLLETLRDGRDVESGNAPTRKVVKGGGVIGLLTRRLAIMSGDPAARTLLTGLLREASRPYMVMLNEWLHHGDIKDLHSEFLIREQQSIRKDRLEQDYTDEYWEKRYTIRADNVPPQLESVKEKVLLAGKYLNVVRECGGIDINKEVQDVPETFDDLRFLDNVNEAYSYANSSLMTLLLTTHALPARLRSMKHYFFLDQSDFFSYFLELGGSELKKHVKSVNVSKLQSLLDLVLRQPGSVAAQDPFKEDIKLQMNEITLTKWLMRVVTVSGIDNEGGLNSYAASHAALTAQTSSTAEDDKNMTGYSALELDYSVPFPISLVISRKTVLRYQLLFRYLLSLRHLEGLLLTSWNDHHKVMSWRHRSSDKGLEIWKRRAWTLRARMIVFVQQLLYFCTSEVIEPNWQGLMARIDGGRGHPRDGPRLGDPVNKHAGGRTVDELMQDHVDFLDTCLKECMLTNSRLLRVQSKIMTTCTMFATYTANLSKTIVTADPDLCRHADDAPEDDAPAKDAGARPSTPRAKKPVAASSEKGRPAYDPNRLAKLSDNLSKYEENFTRHLKILLDALNYYAYTETAVLLGLCARLGMASEGTGSDPGAEPGGGFGGGGLGGGGFR
ncbi:MAG: hypothetical protein M1815_001902 [Lichina confinis]|nr:MAG: hypothetical protein M1815_001902 [Lichina confinis]